MLSCQTHQFLFGFTEEGMVGAMDLRRDLRYLMDQEFILTSWYENGQKWHEVTYKDGEIDGKWTSWYEDGQKEEEETWKDGELDGKCTTWYVNGEKKWETTYKDGEPVD